jgi:hypothetical protein
VAQVARLLGAAAAVAIGALALRAIPDLIRYVKIDRM